MTMGEESTEDSEEPLKGGGGDEENQATNANRRQHRSTSFDGLSSQQNTTSGSENDEQSTPKPVPIQYTATKAPKDTLQAVYKAGEYKAGLTLNLLAVQCFMAGIYIAMAGHLFLAVGGGILGSALFPTGLIAVILTTAELFTGDALVFVASVLGKRVTPQKMIRNWTVAWVMNGVGCLFWAYFLAYQSNSLEDLGVAELAVSVALKKSNQAWHAIFLKGVGANFMVCIGLWQATCAEEVAGKVLGVWFPIAAFVMMGFEHCVANQFLIPVGMMLGADISISHMLFRALLPATLGNIVGGGIMVGAVYWYVYDSMTGNKRALSVIQEDWTRKTTNIKEPDPLDVEQHTKTS